MPAGSGLLTRCTSTCRPGARAKFPAQLYDVKAAIRFLRAHASKYRIDPKHVGIMGTSSGSWTAEMAGLTTGVKRLEGNLGDAKQSSSVQAVVDLFGPSDFLTMDSEKISGGQSHNSASSPESLLIGCALRPARPKHAPRARSPTSPSAPRRSTSQTPTRTRSYHPSSHRNCSTPSPQSATPRAGRSCRATATPIPTSAQHRNHQAARSTPPATARPQPAPPPRPHTARSWRSSSERSKRRIEPPQPKQ